MIATMTGMKPSRRLVLAFLLMIGLLGLAGSVAAQDADPAPKTISFDVAENMNRFVFDKDVAFEDGMPSHGSSFVTQGYIYPKGTLQNGNGVLADGSPEFPDLVLGQWTCRGWFVGDGAHSTSGAWVITTQVYSFGEDLGAETLVSDGYEIADVGIVFRRAITGGTGEYAGAGGVADQVFLGFNASEGVNLTFDITLSE